MSLRIVLTLITGLIFNCHAQVQKDPTLLYEDINIVDVEKGSIIKSQHVLIKNGVIQKVWSHHGESFSDQPNVHVIPASELFMMPGLTDMHVHLEEFESPQILWNFLANGITRIRQMDGRLSLLEWRKRIESGALTGPQIIIAGPILRSRKSREAEHEIVKSFSGAYKKAAAQIAQGYDFIKVYHDLNKKSFQGVMDYARSENIRVVGHVPIQLSLPEVLKLGMSSIEHLDGLDDLIQPDDSPFLNNWSWRNQIFAFPVSVSKIEHYAELIAEHQTWITPTLTAKDWRWLDPKVLKRRRQSPDNQFIPEDFLKKWDPENWQGQRKKYYDNLSQEHIDSIHIGFENAKLVTKEISNRSTKILAGTDTPNPFVVPGFSLHDELRNLHESGLSVSESLKAATLNPAKYFCHSCVDGVVKTGAPANLLILKKNPLLALNHLKSIEAVILAGKSISKEVLQSNLAVNKPD